MGQEHPYEVALCEDELEGATDNQIRAMRLVDENLGEPFTKIAEIGKGKGYSHNESYYRKNYYKFFGPADDKYGRTFEEIKDVYDDISIYDKHRYKFDEDNVEDINGIDDGSKIAISEREEQMLNIALTNAFDAGVKAGRRIERANRESKN